MVARSKRLTLPLFVLLGAVRALSLSSAWASPTHGHTALHSLDSASVGYANSGALASGVRLAPSDSVRYLPGRTLHYGTAELVGLINRVAREIYRRFHVPVTVGDLSAHDGGPVGHHVSHQSGRDADIVFFVRDHGAHDRPVQLDDLVSFDAAGESPDHRLRFDTARNWSLLEDLFSDRQVRVERVFISSPLRARLLSWGRVHGTPAGVSRAAATLVQPAHVSPHDNHFHVRIGCPCGDRACREGVRLRRRRPRHAARGPSHGR